MYNTAVMNRLSPECRTQVIKALVEGNHAVALHFMHYNYCRVHKTLGTTPAVAAGIADHEWSVGEIVNLLESK